MFARLIVLARPWELRTPIEIRLLPQTEVSLLMHLSLEGQSHPSSRFVIGSRLAVPRGPGFAAFETCLKTYVVAIMRSSLEESVGQYAAVKIAILRRRGGREGDRAIGR